MPDGKNMPDVDLFFLSYIDKSQEGEAFTALDKVGASSEDRFLCKYMGREQLENFQEGNFVYITEDNLLVNANNDTVARGEFCKNNASRASFLGRESINPEGAEIRRVTSLCSYHVNVGHGNCSIVVIDDGGAKRIWMVDCSDFDFIIKKSYWANIESCIDYIKSKNGLDNFIIDKFFLTHTHFDHFSGMKKLIQKEYLNGAEVWINLHYSWASPAYTDIISSMKNIDVTFIEPIEQNSTCNINIWHPPLRTVRSKTRKYSQENVQVIKKVNNTSAVYQFVFADKSIVFPGDIETEGWNLIDKCYPQFNKATYFCISHHGSLNGHVRGNCPKGVSVSNLSECNRKFKKGILMGRDKAYNGIYSTKVLSDFSTHIVKTEECPAGKPCSFVEIDLFSDSISYF